MKIHEDRLTTIFQGDARHTDLPDESVQCVVTSPPYWGLRKYAGEQVIKGWGCAYGLEPTIEMYVEHTLVFLREIGRVLRKDGVCFWNIGDSYANDGKWGGETGGKQAYLPDADRKRCGREKRTTGLKPKDLCLIPFRVALAAQADGWWVRSVIIWAKNNPMPESVRDRCTESHEYILMLTKSANYYFDQEAVKEDSVTFDRELERQPHCFGGNKGAELREQGIRIQGAEYHPKNGRNMRSVWIFPSQPYRGAHFATFPEELPMRCIKAATPEAGSCAKCGKPWVRVIDRKPMEIRRSSRAEESGIRTMASGTMVAPAESQTLGWKPQCDCGAETVPALVLDPFCGSGTTLWMAKKLGRRAVGYDISEEYCQLALERNRQMSLWT